MADLNDKYFKQNVLPKFYDALVDNLTERITNKIMQNVSEDWLKEVIRQEATAMAMGVANLITFELERSATETQLTIKIKKG
jgi:hypothetical protein